MLDDASRLKVAVVDYAFLQKLLGERRIEMVWADQFSIQDKPTMESHGRFVVRVHNGGCFQILISTLATYGTFVTVANILHLEADPTFWPAIRYFSPG